METLKKIFHHPNFNAVCGIVTIISLIFAIWTWQINIKEPNLTYYISPTRTPIVQKGSLDNFSVTFMGTQITNDLSSAEIVIWNQGKSAIHRTDIEKTITLRTANGESIYKIDGSESRDVIGFHVINDSTYQAELLSGKLQFDWKILEKDDGIKMHIIYGGSVNVPITVEGIVEGQPRGITQFQTDTNSTSYKISATLNILLMLSVSLCMLLVIKHSGNYLEKIAKRTQSPILKWLILFAYTLLVLFVIVFCFVSVFYFSKPPKPPFGF
jgi:hypothetical protein